MEDNKDDKLGWVIIACSLRLLLEEIITDLAKGKIKVQTSSMLTPVALENRLKQIDALINRLIPSTPITSLNEEEQPKPQNKKGKLN